MALWQLWVFWVCCLWTVQSLLKRAGSPAVHFCFRRNKPDWLSGRNAEDKSVEIWSWSVVRRGRKLWLEVPGFIPGKRNQLFEVMTQGSRGSGVEWAGLESSLWICEYHPCLAKEIIKVVRARGHRDSVEWSLEHICSVSRQSNLLL